MAGQGAVSGIQRKMLCDADLPGDVPAVGGLRHGIKERYCVPGSPFCEVERFPGQARGYPVPGPDPSRPPGPESVGGPRSGAEKRDQGI